MLKYLIHALQFCFLVLPLDLIGIVVCLYPSYNYKLGTYPLLFKWFDDTRGRVMQTLSRDQAIQYFGLGHVEIFEKYNLTAFGRYMWCAFRNSTNYFQHYILGKSHNDPTLWLMSHDGLIRYRIGYKFSADVAHNQLLESLNIPAQWAFSIGIRL